MDEIQLLTEQQIENFKAHISEELGIDYKSEGQKFGWFLDQCAQIKLGFPWEVCFEPTGAVIYYNQQEGEFTSSHPYIDKMKNAMYKLLEYHIL